MGRRKGRGKTARNARKNQMIGEPEEITKAPHTFVIYRGQVGKFISQLMKDLRRVMEPYTASQLKVLKSNVVKDFVAVSGIFNVSHMIMLTRSDIANYMRVAKVPKGPTLTFRIHDYTLARDVISSLKKPHMYDKQFTHHPLLVLNNFSGDGHHMKLMATMFQTMFPSINVHKVRLNKIRRCVLLNYNSEEKTVEFRHYAIKVVPTGISKGVKKLIGNKVPNLSKYRDIDEFLLKSGNLSESEMENDGPENKVVLPQKVSSRGNRIAEQSAIRLVELGPRLTFQLIKIEDGFLEGETVYHEIIQKTEEEIEMIRSKQRKKQKVKENRKKQQEENVRRKQNEKDAQKQKSLNGINKKIAKIKKESPAGDDDGVAALLENPGAVDSVDDDDDAEHFRRETGKEPDEGMFSSSNKRKRKFNGGHDGGDDNDGGGGRPRKFKKKGENVPRYNNNKKKKNDRSGVMGTSSSKSDRDAFKGKKFSPGRKPGKEPPAKFVKKGGKNFGSRGSSSKENKTTKGGKKFSSKTGKKKGGAATKTTKKKKAGVFFKKSSSLSKGRYFNK